MIFATPPLDEQIKFDQQTDLVAEAIAALEVTVASLDKISSIGSKHDKKQKEAQVLPESSDFEGFVAHMNKIRATIRESLRQWQENMEKLRSIFAKNMNLNFVPAANAHVVHRGQGRSGSTGKSSAKKSSTTSGDSGGSGDGDGDGPKHSKKKKNRSSKVRNTSSKHPPSSTTGALQVAPPQSPSVPTPNCGHANAYKGLIAYFLFVLVLFGEIDVVRSFVDSKWVDLVLMSMARLPKVRKTSSKHPPSPTTTGALQATAPSQPPPLPATDTAPAPNRGPLIAMSAIAMLLMTMIALVDQGEVSIAYFVLRLINRLLKYLTKFPKK